MTPLAPHAPASLVVEGVSKRFGDRDVLRDVSLSMEPGGTAAIVGPNGAGKTTLLRIVAGVLAADAGTVRIDAGAPRVAYVPPGDRALYQRLSVRRNLEFFAALGGGAGGDAVRGALAALGGEHLGEQPVTTCSAGERRRVAIARALVTRAPVLLVDEPYSDLDEAGRDAVDAVVASWSAGGGVVVLAMPSPEDGPTARRVWELS